MDKAPFPGLAVGRMVHYIAPGSADGTYPPAHRAAVVTEVETSLDGKRTGIISVMVLNPTGTHFVQNLKSDPTGTRPYTWHQPEYVE